MVAAALALAGCGTSADGKDLQKVVVANNFAPTGIVMPLYTAQIKGYYEDEGLDVSIEAMKSSQDALNAINAGRADIANASVALTIANDAKGIPTVSVGSSVGRHSYGIFTPKDSGITSPKDLEGKTVLATAGFIISEATAVLSKQGVDVDTIDFATLSPAAIANSFAGGQGDAWLTAVPTGAAVTASGRPSDVILMSDLGVTIPDYSYSVAPKTVDKDPTMIEKFLRATYRAQDDVIRDPEAAAEAMAKTVPGVKADALVKQWQSNQTFLCSPNAKSGTSVAAFVPDDWTYASTFLAEIGFTDTPVDVSGMYTNEFSDVTDTTCPVE